MFMTLTTDSMEHSNYHDPQIPPELQTKKLQEPPRISHLNHHGTRISHSSEVSSKQVWCSSLEPSHRTNLTVSSSSSASNQHVFLTGSVAWCFDYHRSCRRALALLWNTSDEETSAPRTLPFPRHFGPAWKKNGKNTQTSLDALRALHESTTSLLLHHFLAFLVWSPP